MKAKFPGFKKCMVMMRKRNPQTREEGFHELLPHAGVYVHELIEEYGKEKDIGLRCWLLELIASAKSSAAFNVLARELRCRDSSLRYWAIKGLKNLDTKEARTLLWQARSFTLGSPEETEEFRRDLDAMTAKQNSATHR
jgi:hypothetical protein